MLVWSWDAPNVANPDDGVGDCVTDSLSADVVAELEVFGIDVEVVMAAEMVRGSCMPAFPRGIERPWTTCRAVRDSTEDY